MFAKRSTALPSLSAEGSPPAHPPAIAGIRRSGDRAVLLELASLDAVLNLHRQLETNPFDGQVDIVAAATSVLVIADSPEALEVIVDRARGLNLSAAAERAGELVVIETVYDGMDLDEASALIGLSPEGLIAAHSGQVWDAAFGGFAPGFMYLAGDGVLNTPRRASPRTSVPAGSVALAGNYSAVYPRESPGGWQLIGHTSAQMWDLDRPNPSLIKPGDRVQFTPARERIPLKNQDSLPPRTLPSLEVAGGITVVTPGMQCTVQDLGRPGLGSLGVSVSGAADRCSSRRANRLAGNPADSAVLEVLFGGLVLRSLADHVLAVTGARVPLHIVGSTRSGKPAGERQPPLNSPFPLLAGETLTLGPPSAGLRSYVAARGGFDIAAVLGSRSTDTLSGIGPKPLKPGQVLAVLPAQGRHVVGSPETPGPLPEGTANIRVVPGPRQDWFTTASVSDFFMREWTVSPQSNRVGLRLTGPRIERRISGELQSEGTVRGSIQVPPDGQPVLFLSDGPVTGGYPVIGVVLTGDLDLVAQLPPGARIRFTAVDPGAPSCPQTLPN